MKMIIGKKLGMTTLFDEKGALNVTLIECAANTVKLARTKDKDGYLAVQLEARKTKNRTIRQEVRFDKPGTALTSEELEKLVQSFPEASELTVTQFAVGDRVSVSGVTKAKGFQGVVKRHGFGGAPSSHGRKHDMRKPGSIGPTFPEHVIKGRRMAGRMGGANFTVRNLSVAYVDPDQGLIGVKGAVPGVPGGLVKVISLTESK